MTLTARKNHFFSAPAAPTSSECTAPISNTLVANGTVDPGDMVKAMVLQRHENQPLEVVLRGLGLASDHHIAAALGTKTALPVVDLYLDPPDPSLAEILPATVALQHRFVIWKQQGGVTFVAIADPNCAPTVHALLADKIGAVQCVLASRGAILKHYETVHSETLSAEANSRVPEGLSCRTWAQSRLRYLAAIVLIMGLATMFVAPAAFANGIFLLILGSLLANGIFKLTMLLTYLRHKTPPSEAPRPQKLPKISILIPLLREEDIVNRLIERMGALKYPKELLEICLVYEASDTRTRDHIKTCAMPYWMRGIEVPADTLQTKPRAMNYALDFCTGDVIGIYDAEDAPEPDQLYKVVQKFENAPENVACVQCQLDYYNSSTNWISRCFTIEYAILFRVILPGLQHLNLPIPLGGTSVFFHRSVLESLGRWDAQNVTEDADLGLRLHRKGYRCLHVDATTYEEANFRALPWVRQRSRWLKGFLQTWITHMRHPVATLRELGFWGFLAFQVQMMGTVASFAAAPFVLPLWLLTFGFDFPVYQHLSTTLLTALIVGFICTEVLLLCLGIYALRTRNSPKMAFAYLPMMLLYWPMGALGAYKAIYELFVCPTYWDKTEHGINDQVYQSEIVRLTKAPGSIANSK